MTPSTICTSGHGGVGICGGDSGGPLATYGWDGEPFLVSYIFNYFLTAYIAYFSHILDRVMMLGWRKIHSIVLEELGIAMSEIKKVRLT